VRKILLSGLAAILLLATGVVSADVYQWIDADGVRHYSNTPPPDDARIVNRFAEEKFDPAEERKIREAEDRELAKLQERLARARAQQAQARQEAERQRAERQEAENQRRIQELEQQVEELKRRRRRPVWIGPYLPEAVPYPAAGNL
jgi:TolA-binding protein